MSDLTKSAVRTAFLIEPVELAEPDLDGAVRIGDDAIGIGDADL